MLKKQLILLCTLVFALPLAMAVAGRQAPAKTKEARWEGRVIRSSKPDSTLTVRTVATPEAETTVKYDSATKWVSQFHGDKKVNVIDASEVKDGDYVICTGTWEKTGVLHATQISKRLSHSPE